MTATTASRKVSNATIRSAMEKAAKNLVSSTNIMGGDKLIASKVLEVLQKPDYGVLLFLLIRESVPEMLERISHTDGRSEATIRLLKTIDTTTHESVFPKSVAVGFATGVAGNHNTLIQSFFRVMQIVSRAIVLDKEIDETTETQGYLDAMNETSEALNEMLSMLSEITFPADINAMGVVQDIASDDHYLAFI